MNSYQRMHSNTASPPPPPPPRAPFFFHSPPPQPLTNPPHQPTNPLELASKDDNDHRINPFHDANDTETTEAGSRNDKDHKRRKIL